MKNSVSDFSLKNHHFFKKESRFFVKYLDYSKKKSRI